MMTTQLRMLFRSVVVLAVIGMGWMLHRHPQEVRLEGVEGIPKGYGHRVHAGYLNVSEHRALYYVLCESQSNPSEDPVILWMNGGPGCSSLLSMFMAHGPWRFQTNTTVLEVNQHAWNLQANMLYLESPVGTGFSPADSTTTSPMNDTHTARDNLQALKLFFRRYPQLRDNALYLTGESYAGIYVPYLAEEVLQHNQAQPEERMNIQGVMLGSACTHPTECFDPKMLSAHVLLYLNNRGFFQEELWQRYRQQCPEIYSNRESLSEACSAIYHQLMDWADSLQIDLQHIYDKCYNQEFNGTYPAMKCSDVKGVLTLLNSPSFRHAFHVGLDNKTLPWSVCSRQIKYQVAKGGSVDIYPRLVEAGLRILLYTGDADAMVPTTGTIWWLEQWLASEPTTRQTSWRQWKVDGSVAGYVWRLEGLLTYVTVAKAGHSSGVTRPKQMLALLHRFLSDDWQQ